MSSPFDVALLEARLAELTSQINDMVDPFYVTFFDKVWELENHSFRFVTLDGAELVNDVIPLGPGFNNQPVNVFTYGTAQADIDEFSKAWQKHEMELLFGTPTPQQKTNYDLYNKPLKSEDFIKGNTAFNDALADYFLNPKDYFVESPLLNLIPPPVD